MSIFTSGQLKDLDRKLPTGAYVFLTALIGRALALPFTLTGLNPYARMGGTRFANSATRIAGRFASGEVFIPDLTNTVEMWGLILSPLWLLPGPSRLYGILFSLCFGAVASYNVFRLGRKIHSTTAGLIAVVPLLTFPSFLIIHTSVHRESFILALLTFSMVCVIDPPKFLSSNKMRFASLGVCIVLATLVRYENILVYLLIVVIGIVFYGIDWPVLNRRVKTGILATNLAIAIILWAKYREFVIKYLGSTRGDRARGRSAYLVNAIPTNTIELAAVSLIGAVYFLYSPFPWQSPVVIIYLPVMIEGALNLLYTVSALWGIHWFYNCNESVCVATLFGLITFVLIYGVVNANAGISVRQRQMFVWVIYVLGGVGATELIKRRQTSLRLSDISATLNRLR